MIGIDVAGRKKSDALEVSNTQGQIPVLANVDQQNRTARSYVRQCIHGVLGLVVGHIESLDHFQLAIPHLRGKRRPQRPEHHFSRQLVAVIPRNRPVDGTAMTPDRRANRTHTRPASALLFPELFAGASHFGPGFGLVGARPQSRLVLTNRFVKQRLVDFGAKHFVGQLQVADLLIIQIHYIDCRHGSYLFALRTITYPPFGPGTAPFTTSTLSSRSTSTISRFRTVTRSCPMWPAMRIPGSTREGKLEAPIEPGARWNIDP